MVRLRTIAVIALFPLACGSDPPQEMPPDSAAPGDPDAAPIEVGPAAALFELPREGAPPSDFYALPFPNDIRADADGAIDLRDYPRPNDLLDMYIETFQAKHRGFSINAASYLRFSGPIDPASLPADPRAAQEDDAAVYLVNIDPDSPGRGTRSPLRFRFEHYPGETIGPDWLAVLPYPGFVLDERTTYAVVVTGRLLASDGSPVTRPDAFAPLLEDLPPTTDEELARAHGIYAPLRAWLDEGGGDERDDVAVASVFTTQDATSLIGRMREVIWRLPEPHVYGVFFRSLKDEYVWYDGLYDAPIFQNGIPPYDRPADGGEIEVDPQTGDPIVFRTETMRVSFSLPRGPMPEAGWPVVLYGHGTGGSFHSFKNDGTAARMGKQGLAVISIDQTLHGPRNPEGGSPEIAFFNFQNPVGGRDNARQGAADFLVLVRVVLGFRYTERHPGGKTIRFDPDRIYYMGHSHGGLSGPPFLAFSPEVKGAVLSGAGGLIYWTLLLKTEPVDIPSLTQLIVRDFPLDEFNPVLALVQMFIDSADPVTYGPLLVRRPPAGIDPKHIFQSEGFVDHYTPNPNIEALATAIGTDPVAPVLQSIEGLALAGRPVLEAPLTGNQNGITSVLLQYNQAADSDGHYVVFDIEAARKQHAEFLGSLARTGQATLVAP